MSLPPPSLGKSLSSPLPAASHTAASPSPSLSGFDSSSRRASVQSNGAAGASTSVTMASTAAAPRKGQGARKQHRNQRRAADGTNINKSYRRPDDDDAMAEARALRNTSSRRGQTSITHLLNYAAPSRAYLDRALDHRYNSQSYRSSGGGGGGGGGYHHRQHNHHHTAAGDKARFVHANYRFVVSPTGDYTRQAADADERLDWDDVLQILASTESQSSACPICLSEPVAPRMAKCGHIFCLACLIRFMHASSEADEPARGGGGGGGGSGPRPANSIPGLYTNNASGTAPTATATATTGATNGESGRRKAKWKKCPICEDSIYLAEVRPVRFYAGQECALPRPGDDVVLRLMMRHAHSTVALPREGSGGDVLAEEASATAASGSSSRSRAKDRRGGDGIPWHFAANVLDYARIMKGTGDYMVEQFGRELEDLARQEREDELLFHEDGEWSQRAARMVRTAREAARALGGLEVALLESSGSGSSRAAAEKPQLPSLRPEDGQQHQQHEEDFFFYEAPPHLYLSPLDIRILKTKYGTFSSFPSTLLPRVEHLSLGHTVDDAMRRRAKYLGHLPAGCVVSFLECDWTDIVPEDTLAVFAGDIERRRKRNRDKAAQEERERLQAERLELAAARSTRRLGASSGGVGSGSSSAGIRSGGGGRSGSGFFHGDDDNNDGGFGVDMSGFLPLGGEPASSSSSPPNPRPGFGHLVDLATSPTTMAGRTVWGTRAVAASPGLGPAAAAAADAAHLTYGDDVDDGWLRDEQLLAVGDLSDAELAASMAALGVDGSGSGSGSGSGTGGGDGIDGAADGANAARGPGGSTKTSAPAAANKNGSKKKKKQKITLMSTGGRRGL